MRVPHTFRVIVALATLVLPATAVAQSLATMPLTTQSPEAMAALREGVGNAGMLYPAAAVRQFRLALEKDPGFALARAFRAHDDPTLTTEQRRADADRAVADASRATTTEMALVLMLREEVYGRGNAAQAMRRAMKALLPEEVTYWRADLPPTTTPKEAAARSREATTKFPDQGQALNQYAYNLWAVGDRKGALDAARRQVERWGKQPNPHDSYAELLAWSGDLDGAEQHYRHAIEIAPDFTEGYAGLAEVAAMRGDGARARTELERALQHTDDPALRIDYTRQLAGTWALEANREKTREHLKKAAELAAAQADTVAMGLLDAQLAPLAALDGNADAAHALVTRATTLRPKAVGVLYFAAMTHAVLGHEAPARAALTTAREQPAGKTAPGMHRLTAVDGYIHIKGERPRPALAALQKADTTDLVVLSWIAEANRMLGSTTKANAQFTRIRDDREIDLTDFAEVNARQRARTALAPRAAVRD
jgi:tetratricopeptide (TPR) repeat protein